MSVCHLIRAFTSCLAPRHLSHCLDRVVSNNTLTGGLPAEMCTMSNLTAFLAGNNRLQGTIPLEWGGLVRSSSNGWFTPSTNPECVMRSLTFLDVGNNAIRCDDNGCTLPVGLPQLTSLDLQGNHLKGMFVSALWIAKSTASTAYSAKFGLMSLNIANNTLTGLSPSVFLLPCCPSFNNVFFFKEPCPPIPIWRRYAFF